ncbi:MAG: hypothetical protein LIP10_03630 [Clostridiales bacterium]|nr:hypothetical protein [Clostridiales bacterium]
MAYKQIANINIENAEIMSRQGFDRDNFGKKSICVFLDMSPEDIQSLVDEGWNIHVTRPSENFPEPRHFLPVEIKYDVPEEYENLQPRIYMYVEGRMDHRVTLNERTVSKLARSRIVNIDITIRGRWIEDNPDTGDGHIKAYVSVMRVTIAKPDDAFAEKYAEEEYPEDE